MRTLKLLLLASFLCKSLHGFSQSSDITIKGSVVANDQTPIPGAIISLQTESADAPIKTFISDTDGGFEITGIAPHTYLLSFRIIGFKTIVQKINIEQSADLGIIKLEEDVQHLNEVIVAAAPIYLESKPGNTSYLVSRDPTAIGKSLIDLAEHLPGISKTGSGALTYGGENGVVILVNGKRSNLSSTDVLQLIPPSDVDKIELLSGTNPRFVSLGAPAVLNIVLVKNKSTNLNGNLGIITNTNGNVNGSISLRKFKEKLNLYTLIANDERFLQTNTNYKRFDRFSGATFFSGENKNSVHHSLRSVTTGIDIYADSSNIVTIEHTASFHTDRMDATISRSIGSEAPIKSSVRSGPKEWENTFSINHQKQFHSTNRLLESEISGTNFSLNNSKVYGKQNSIEQLAINNYALRVRSEYSMPTQKGSFNLGVDAQAISTQGKVAPHPYQYHNQTIAGYTSRVIDVARFFSISPGLRFEHTKSAAKSAIVERLFDRLAFYPSLNVLYEPSTKHKIAIDINRRVQYPDVHFLYTDPNQPDTFNITRGNVNVIPAIRYDASLEHQYTSSKFNLTMRLTSRLVNNAISTYYSLDENNVMNDLAGNVGVQFGYGAFSNFTWSLANFSVRGGANYSISNVKIAAEIPAHFTKLYSISGHLANRYKINKNADAEFTMRVMNVYRTLSEEYKPMYNISFQFNYKLNEGKWVLSVLAHDVFKTMVDRGTIIPSGNIEHRFRATYLSRFLQLTIRYKFGMIEKNRKRQLDNGTTRFTNG